MSFGSHRRVMYSTSLVVILVMFVLQVWVCGVSNCKAGAIRLLQENGVSKFKESGNNITTTNNFKSKEEYFRKYFNERGNTSRVFNKTEKGFVESKRRVPSCPDPLHN
ncbi:CLAVATA3/ESR (CLE)-RELATED PROTEIN 27 [Salix koriyanagi]|uniref:CLAVATA3/ESR (CLE)-RELATED PROTEIN 27 n=1 Tax=Salix koriyanagi TaxID=2511006 RepID=A0A9Q0WJZ5_9ROSI|nr:CLAVATA3/ESR (CLE)-RELATED PROTEIN 27 [Salix koriyanagi]